MMIVAWALMQATAAPAAAPITLQAQFELATAAFVAQQWEPALAGFRAIQARPGVSARTRGVAMLREGQALNHLSRPEAADVLRKGLALLPDSDNSLNDDRVDALLTLGGIERGDFDYVAARREFQLARTLTEDPALQLTSLMSLADVTMFDDNRAALAYIDSALKIAADRKVSPVVDGRMRDIRGRVLLNAGDYAGAIGELEIALKDHGGLTSKTDLDDVAVRSDLTLAYLLSKNRDKARSIMGMTGEGRVPDNAMLSAPSDGDLPDCGGDIAPDDVAVIEFGIGGDGAVLYTTPIYASRPGTLAAEFARAVYGWSWDPARLKDVPPFYRLATRVELRCTTASERPSPIALLGAHVDAWLVAREVKPPAERNDAPTVARLKAELVLRDSATPNDVALIPLMMAVAGSSATPYAETRNLYERAGRIAAAAKAPPVVLTYFGVRSATPRTGKRRDIDAYEVALAHMLAANATDARSAATLHLLLALSQRTRDPSGATRHLDAIVGDHELDARDPLKIGALLQLAAFRAQANDIPAAQRLYQLTGLDDQQCALVDVAPAHLKGKAGEQDYPQDARAWGISGWARTEFDIRADGGTEHVRTVMAHPPFIFGPPIERVAARMKYTQSFRPQGGLGCGGQTYQQGFHYVTP